VLLQRDFTNIIWIDPEFEGGAMNYYKGIPGNTKANLLSKFTRMLPLYNNYWNTHDDVDVFKGLDPIK
jgi:hypothetical protein